MPRLPPKLNTCASVGCVYVRTCVIGRRGVAGRMRAMHAIRQSRSIRPYMHASLHPSAPAHRPPAHLVVRHALHVLHCGAADLAPRRRRGPVGRALPRQGREVQHVRVRQHLPHVAPPHHHQLVKGVAVGGHGEDDRRVVEARRGALAPQPVGDVLPAEAVALSAVEDPHVAEHLPAAAVAAKHKHAAAEAGGAEVRARGWGGAVVLDAGPAALAVRRGLKQPEVVEADAPVQAAKHQQAAAVELGMLRALAEGRCWWVKESLHRLASAAGRQRDGRKMNAHAAR
jgi:hypothetical protein